MSQQTRNVTSMMTFGSQRSTSGPVMSGKSSVKRVVKSESNGRSEKVENGRRVKFEKMPPPVPKKPKDSKGRKGKDFLEFSSLPICRFLSFLPPYQNFRSLRLELDEEILVERHLDPIFPQNFFPSIFSFWQRVQSHNCPEKNWFASRSFRVAICFLFSSCCFPRTCDKFVCVQLIKIRLDRSLFSSSHCARSLICLCLHKKLATLTFSSKFCVNFLVENGFWDVHPTSSKIITRHVWYS